METEMNDLVKELIKKSTTTEEHGWGASYENFDREKFAELIVRECADIATINQYQPLTAGTYVLKHFGVE